jgi:hypothetical protein
VDEKRLLLYKSFVPGPTLRQRLAASGARILSCETDADPRLAGLSPPERLAAVWERGREHFDAAVSPDLLDLLRSRRDAIHRGGVTGFSLTFGNVVIGEGDGKPWFIDFDAARTHHRPGSPVFAYRRDRDRELFDRIYLGASRSRESLSTASG